MTLLGTFLGAAHLANPTPFLNVLPHTDPVKSVKRPTVPSSVWQQGFLWKLPAAQATWMSGLTTPPMATGHGPPIEISSGPFLAAPPWQRSDTPFPLPFGSSDNIRMSTGIDSNSQHSHVLAPPCAGWCSGVTPVCLSTELAFGILQKLHLRQGCVVFADGEDNSIQIRVEEV